MASKSAALSRRSKRARPRNWVRTLKIFSIIGFVVAVILGGAGYGIWIAELRKASSKLPMLDKFRERLSVQPTVIVSADGKTLFTMSAEYRKPVSIGQIPKVVKDATLAAEDRRFYEHSGVDEVAVLRQMFTNVRERRIAGGASTLTMQLAKRLYSQSERSWRRKLQDMAMAVQIERSYTKDMILEMYLNQVFYGSGAYGIQAAADVYFGKELDQLTVAEAATLARCVRRPTDENPFSNKEQAILNRNIVLRSMLAEGMITQSVYDRAIEERLRLQRKPERGPTGHKEAPYFVDYVLDYVRDNIPEIDLDGGGYRIETTLDSRMQEISEKAVRDLVAAHKNWKVRTGAFLLVDRSGGIKAMVGGVDYKRNQFNVITQGRRQPGSSFKPFVYSAAFSMGELDPQDSLSNAPYHWTDPATGKVWSPKNSNGKFGGMVSIRSAFSLSLNMPAIRAMEKVGPHRFVGFARQTFGFKSKLDPVLALALGSTAVSPMEMATGYSVFMLQGNRIEPLGVTRIVGPDGSVVREFSSNERTGVLSSSVADDVDTLLRAVVTGGTATRARVVEDARGKTGTTSDNKDAWFIGYAGNLLGVGWIANEIPSSSKDRKWDYEPMARQVYGGTVTIKMWTDIVGKSLKFMDDSSPRPEAERHEGHETRVDVPVTEPPPEPDVLPDEPAREVEPGNSQPGPAPAGTEPKVKEPEPATETEPRPEPKRAEGNITLVICADSGMIAVPGCPEQTTLRFKRGTQPRGKCPLHQQ